MYGAFRSKLEEEPSVCAGTFADILGNVSWGWKEVSGHDIELA